MHNENWDDLRYILAVAEGGSVSAAARALGVNHATVLRRVAAFEERHGVSLFEKGARGYTIPPDRLRIVEAAREAEAAIAAVGRLMQGRAAPAAGRVRITTTDTFSLTIVPAILAALETPGGPRFELLTSNGHLDFSRLHADITIRPAARLPDDLAGERAADLAFAAYGRPERRPHWLGRARRARRLRPRRLARRDDGRPTRSPAAPTASPPARHGRSGPGRAILPCILGDASPVLARLPEAPGPRRPDLGRKPRRPRRSAAAQEPARRHRRRPRPPRGRAWPGSGEAHLADVGQVAVPLREVDAVTHDEFVGDLEPRPGRLDRHLAPRRLVEQRDDLEPRGSRVCSSSSTWTA